MVAIAKKPGIPPYNKLFGNWMKPVIIVTIRNAIIHHWISTIFVLVIHYQKTSISWLWGSVHYWKLLRYNYTTEWISGPGMQYAHSTYTWFRQALFLIIAFTLILFGCQWINPSGWHLTRPMHNSNNILSYDPTASIRYSFEAISMSTSVPAANVDINAYAILCAHAVG